MTLNQELRKRYKQGGGWREFFDMLSTYTNRVGATTAENAAKYTGLAYETIVMLMRDLDELGVGEFKFGRRGGKTRLIWNYSPASVGEVACGKKAELDPYPDAAARRGDEVATMTFDDDSDDEAVREPRHSLSEMVENAKRELADQLGVQPEQIEIVIKH